MLTFAGLGLMFIGMILMDRITYADATPPSWRFR